MTRLCLLLFIALLLLLPLFVPARMEPWQWRIVAAYNCGIVRGLQMGAVEAHVHLRPEYTSESAECADLRKTADMNIDGKLLISKGTK